MPEGDTIYRSAAALRAALLGKPVRQFTAHRLVGHAPKVGAVTEWVESKGKHLEIGWDDGVVLHTHMRMTGSWHLYRHGEIWRKSPSQARVVIESDTWEAVCFNAPVVDTYRAEISQWHPGMGRLGPDLCRADADLAVCVGRSARYCDPLRPLADVLLDQRVACGVGNVFKSEVLWACLVHPQTPVGALDSEQLMFLFAAASRMLRNNIDIVNRVTYDRSPTGLAVYGRHNKPCLRCGDTIAVARHGEHARATFWCPGCQVRLGPPTVELPDAPRRSDRWFGPAATVGR